MTLLEQNLRLLLSELIEKGYRASSDDPEVVRMVGMATWILEHLDLLNLERPAPQAPAPYYLHKLRTIAASANLSGVRTVAQALEELLRELTGDPDGARPEPEPPPTPLKSGEGMNGHTEST